MANNNNILCPNTRLSVEEVNLRKNANLDHLIGRRKLHLVLDLDHTLVASKLLVKSVTMEEIQIMKDVQDKHVFLSNDHTCSCKLRPGVREFLRKASAMFDISVYTMGGRIYATKVVQLLQSEVPDFMIKNVFAREDCFHNGVKELDVVLEHSNVVLIVDDKVNVWREQDRRNVIEVARFEDDPWSKEDKELDRVLKILTKVYNEFYDYNSTLHGHCEKDYSKNDVRSLLSSVQCNA